MEQPDIEIEIDEALPTPTPLSRELEETIRRALELEANAKAPNTRRAYVADWRDFQSYCTANGFPSLPAPPRVVQLYLTYLADYCTPPPKIATIKRRLAAIAKAHQLRDLPSPTRTNMVKHTMEGIVRAYHKTRGRVPKRSIQDDELRELLRFIPGDRLIELRDRALTLFTFLGAFRRSEVSKLQYHNLTFDKQGVVIRLSEATKTNQFQEEIETIAIKSNPDPALCPVVNLQKWLAAANITEGAIFRNLKNGQIGESLSAGAIYDVVRARVLDRLCAWLNDNAPDDEIIKNLKRKDGTFIRSRFTGPMLDTLLSAYQLPPLFDPRSVGAHSLRSGFVTTARRKHRPDHGIQRQGRWKDPRMLDVYTHSQDVWINNPTDGLI